MKYLSKAYRFDKTGEFLYITRYHYYRQPRLPFYFMRERDDQQGQGELHALKTPEWREEMPLREALCYAVFSPKLAIDRKVQRLRLNQLGYESQRLMRATFANRDEEESGRIAYVTARGEVIIDSRLTVGQKFPDLGNSRMTEFSIEIKVLPQADKLPRHLRQDKYIAAILHTHVPHELPPSPPDLLLLFLDSSVPLAGPLQYVSTPRAQWLFFRGENTPQWDVVKANHKANVWLNAIDQRTQRLKDQAVLYKSWRHYLAHVQGAFLSQLAAENDLQIFFAPSGGEMAERKNSAFIRDFYRP